jgi:hypothetical protein
MLNKEQVCDQISVLYPDFGQCGDDLEVNWDEENQAWAVDFKLNGREIRHYLEDEDAAACVTGRQCMGMGIEFGQFR